MRYLALALGIGSAFAQTATMTAPGSGTPTLSGDAGQVRYALTSSCSSCGVTVVAAAYYLDGNPSVPGSGELLGISRTPPYVYHWNPYYASNGVHTVYVDYLSTTNSVVATSPTVAFNVANNLPQTTCATTCSSISVSESLIAEMGVGGGDPYLFNVISFYGSSGTPAMVGGAKCGGVASGATVLCSGVTAGHTVAVYYKWGPSTATLTCSPSSGTIAYGTEASNAGVNWAAQWCYAYNVSGGTFSMTASGAAFTGAIAFEISGTVTTNPKDVDVAISGEGPNPLRSAGFSLGFAPANEIVLGGAIWDANTIPTPGPGWSYATNPTSAGQGIGVEVINPLGAIFGTEQLTVTVNGPNSGISKTFSTFVDGVAAANVTPTTSASGVMIFNTTQFLNGSHQVALRVDGGNCPGCTDGTWSDMGGWEQGQTFSNLVVPSQLLMSAREVMMTAGGPPVTVTGTDQNTDGSATAATIVSCVYDSASGTGTTYFTVAVSGGACVVTPTSTAGIDYITATDSNGFTRVFWPFVLTSGQNTIPNLGSDGQIHLGYVSNSIWRASAFVNGSAFLPFTNGQTGGVNFATQWGPALAQIGQNTIEGGCELPSNYGNNQSSFETGISSDIAGIQANFAAYGQGKLKYVHLICDGYFRTSSGMFGTMLGPASPVSASNPAGGSGAWTINPWPYMLQQYVTAGLAMGVQGVDEVGLSWGGNPMEGTNTGGIIIGTNSFSALTGNGTTCAATWPASLNDRFTGASTFIITGSGTALDYVPSTNSPIFRYSSRTATAINFPCSYTGTITSGSLQLQTFVANTWTASGTACSGTSGVTPPGPCPQYLPYNLFSTIRGWLTSVTNFPPMDWPLAGGCCTYGIANWSGATQVGGLQAGDYWVSYVGTFGGTYLPYRKNISPLIGNVGDLLRSQGLNYMNRATPLVVETTGDVNDYTIGPYPSGYQIAVTSCSGNTITFASDHLIRNVISGFTKFQVVGSTACDNQYYVIAAPNSTQLSVVLANSTASASASTGSVTFPSDGNTYALNQIAALNSGAAFNTFGPVTLNCAWRAERGRTFTISGTGSSTLNAMTGWADNAGSPNNCSGAFSFWRQIPNLSSTGGTAYILPDAWYRRGNNWVTNSDTSAREMFASAAEAIIEGASGVRQYQTGADPQLSDLTVIGVNNAMLGETLAVSRKWNGTDLLNSAYVAGVDPITDYGRTIEAALGHANLNLFASRILKYLYQPRLNSPDFGAAFEAAARSGSFGNLLMIQSFLDAPGTCTANLAPYLVAGQPVIRYSMTWDSIQAVDVIAAGTTTDSKTCAPGEFRAYVFPVNEAAEFAQPVIAARLADVANAADILVQYSYSLLSFGSPAVAAQTPYQTFNCGTGTCQLPVDKNIGPVYYRLIYLDGSGRILTPPGAIETL
jgi:hypothetical protein